MYCYIPTLKYALYFVNMLLYAICEYMLFVNMLLNGHLEICYLLVVKLLAQCQAGERYYRYKYFMNN